MMMKWSAEAEATIKKVPFFVRKKVRLRIEEEVASTGKKMVSLADVMAAQARFMSNMNSEIKGYQIDICFGPGGCPNRANSGKVLLERIEVLLKKENLLDFLKERVHGDIKYHHEFRVTLAECPNACSQPQIKDIGILGAVVPKITCGECTRCEACIETCIENCIEISNKRTLPEIDHARCLKCGRCVDVCPSGTIVAETKGFRIQLGGKLGRHPRLARELHGIFSGEEVLSIVNDCIAFYKRNSKHGERFAEIFSSHGHEFYFGIPEKHRLQLNNEADLPIRLHR